MSFSDLHTSFLYIPTLRTSVKDQNMALSTNVSFNTNPAIKEFQVFPPFFIMFHRLQKIK